MEVSVIYCFSLLVVRLFVHSLTSQTSPQCSLSPGALPSMAITEWSHSSCALAALASVTLQGEWGFGVMTACRVWSRLSVMGECMNDEWSLHHWVHLVCFLPWDLIPRAPYPWHSQLLWLHWWPSDYSSLCQHLAGWLHSQTLRLAHPGSNPRYAIS